MTTRRLTTTAFALLAALAVVVLMLTSPSRADPKKLLVSTSADGPFRDNLATALFADGSPFVPLDRATSAFYVKNNTKQDARATLAVVNRGATNAFEQALTFDVDIVGTHSDGAVPDLGNPGCTLVTTGPNLAPGAVQKIDVSLAVADLQQQLGQRQAASLDFVVTLTQAGPRGHVEVCGEQATAQPEVKGEQAHADGQPGQQCTRDVVVTTMGTPTCVPTVVNAGAATYGSAEPRSPREIVGLAVLLMGGGAGIVLLGARRRRDSEAPGPLTS